MVGMGGSGPSLAACSFSAATSKFQADTPCTQQLWLTLRWRCYQLKDLLYQGLFVDTPFNVLVPLKRIQGNRILPRCFQLALQESSGDKVG